MASTPLIVSDPDHLHGQPRIAGTRIGVGMILEKFAAGQTEEGILRDYPHLTVEQVRAAAAWAAEQFTAKLPNELEFPE